MRVAGSALLPLCPDWLTPGAELEKETEEEEDANHETPARGDGGNGRVWKEQGSPPSVAADKGGRAFEVTIPGTGVSVSHPAPLRAPTRQDRETSAVI